MLARRENQSGYVPGALAALAENPSALRAYLDLSRTFSGAGFSPQEAEIVLLAASIENGCRYCVAAHSAAAAAAGMDADSIERLRRDRPLSSARLEILRQFTKRMVSQRGFLCDAEMTRFLASGWTRSHALAVVLGVTLKTLSTYTNHMAETPLDDALQAYAWTPGKRSETFA